MRFRVQLTGFSVSLGNSASSDETASLGDSASKPLRDLERAVERLLADLVSDQLVLVACSGGADSLALAAATAKCQTRGLIRAGAVVVDHGLQSGSLEVAAKTAERCASLGLAPVEVMQVEVAQGPGSGGLEAAAREARYTALESAATRLGASAVLLAHTQDDQAETVLLGLARGSGSRSIKGMDPVRGLWRRPLLDVRRADTEAVCEALGLTPYTDAHNQDQQFARVRVRHQAIPALRAALGDSVVPSLARTAQQLQDDCAALDTLAEAELAARVTQVPGASWRLNLAPAGWRDLAEVPRAIRTRVLRLFLLHGGLDPERLASTHIDAIDSLVTDWRGRGPVRLPGDHELARVKAGLLLLYKAAPLQN